LYTVTRNSASEKNEMIWRY